MDQIMAPPTSPALKNAGKKFPVIASTKVAIEIGKTQYPINEMDWKNEMDDPSNCVLRVIMQAPIHTSTKIVAKMTSASDL